MQILTKVLSILDIMLFMFMNIPPNMLLKDPNGDISMWLSRGANSLEPLCS